MKVGPASTRRERAEALRREAEETLAEGADPREWARQHGIKVPRAR